ncbi:MAG TPA: PspC domain-containing protein [Candidatus Choladousia intestinipullorum]|nr:PspC domain-containing protein [Candidatus Choladousia intestinipullorum]
MKRLYKSRNDSKICGVCGGIAEYFRIDSTVVRLIFVVAALLHIGIPLYLFAALLMPQSA